MLNFTLLTQNNIVLLICQQYQQIMIVKPNTTGCARGSKKLIVLQIKTSYGKIGAKFRRFAQ